jgi:hypothetical protein
MSNKNAKPGLTIMLVLKEIMTDWSKILFVSYLTSSFDVRNFYVLTARPPASAVNYLVDLVAHIQQSNGSGDARSEQQLAADLGISHVVLSGLNATTPQQTALNVFKHLYPGYAKKTILRSVENLEILKPGLLDTILGNYILSFTCEIVYLSNLVVAQRATPGVAYVLQDLRETLGNSIRGARYHYRKKNGDISEAVAFLEADNVNGCDSVTETNENISHNNPSDVIDIYINKENGVNTFDDNEFI